LIFTPSGAALTIDFHRPKHIQDRGLHSKTHPEPGFPPAFAVWLAPNSRYGLDAGKRQAVLAV
jgi:hypothetical protein